MDTAARRAAERFIAGLRTGDLPAELFTDDLQVWTTLTKDIPGEKYLAGARTLHTLFVDGPRLTIDELTIQDDRVAAEVHGGGPMRNGEHYDQRYVFVFRVRDGRIASVAEHLDTEEAREKLMPLRAQTRSQGHE